MARYTNVIEPFPKNLSVIVVYAKISRASYREENDLPIPVWEFDTDDLDHAVWFKLKFGGTLRDNGEPS